MPHDQLIVVPLGTELLAFTRDEFDAARTRARELGFGAHNGASHVEPLVDSAQLAAITHLPQGWLEEAGRQGRVPVIAAGKYKRYRATDVIAALATAGVTHREHHQRQRRNRRRSET